MQSRGFLVLTSASLPHHSAPNGDDSRDEREVIPAPLRPARWRQIKSSSQWSRRYLIYSLQVAIQPWRSHCLMAEIAGFIWGGDPGHLLDAQGGRGTGLDPGAAARPAQGSGSYFWNPLGPFWKQETPRSEGWGVPPSGGSSLLVLRPPSPGLPGSWGQRKDSAERHHRHFRSIKCVTLPLLPWVRAVPGGCCPHSGPTATAEGAPPTPQACHLPVLHHPAAS